jgi:hypothetical protein
MKFIQSLLHQHKLYLTAFVFALLIFGNRTSASSPSDAIAIRVLPNPNHYSPMRWYAEQKFTGSPQAMRVDGYEAVRDGRTVYVNVANISGGNLYTNIYLMSYNQNAENATQDIFNQILIHWKFNSDLTAVSSCKKNITINCLINSDCPEKDYCLSDKAQVIRDTKRLADLGDIKNALKNYKQSKGHYPILNSGTYITNKTISVWPSWKTFSGEVGYDLPIDPINKLGPCDAESYDQITCWDDKNKKFADPTPANGEFNLPDESYAYIYTTNTGGTSFNLCANTESGFITPADGSCLGDISINNPPIIQTNNLTSGSPNKKYSGFIQANDPDGDLLSWSIYTASTVWTGWSAPPILRNTSLSNQKEVYADLAGAVGSYDITLTVKDSRGGETAKKFTIQIKTCADADGDGYGISGSSGCAKVGIDCNDLNAAINPGATEICDNSIDEDCSGIDLACTDTIAPTVSAFDVQPKISPASVLATFKATDNSTLKRAELWRADYVAVNCDETVKTGCSWFPVQTKNISGLSQSGNFTETPAAGSYWYGIHVIDATGNIGNEPVLILVKISAPACADNLCNSICSPGCTVDQDPDCGCKNSNACCGIGCSSAIDNDCITPCIPNCTGKCGGDNGCGVACPLTCLSPNPFCASDNKTCVACLKDGDCPPLQKCDAFKKCVTALSGNKKELSKFSAKKIFLISDDNWQEAISLAPLTTWTAQSSEEYGNCVHAYNGAANVCAYPTFIYHKEGPTVYDADSILYFIDQYSANSLAAVNPPPTELTGKINGKGITPDIISLSDYLSYWQNYEEAVYVQNNYQLALLSSAFASLKNAPLIIQGSSLDAAGTFSGKKVYTIGSVSCPASAASCENIANLPALEQKYYDLTNTDKLILVNYNDLAISINESFKPADSSNANNVIYSKNSLAAPILAGAKHELIISTNSDTYAPVDSFIDGKISTLSMNPEYLTIIASPNAIEMQYTDPSLGYLSTDEWQYSKIDSDNFLDLSIGRIFGITVSDTSSNIARNLFYDRTLKNDKILITLGLPFLTNAADVYALSKSFSTIGYGTTMTTDGTKASDWLNKMFITYLDHGSQTWVGIDYSAIPQLDNTFIQTQACLSCDFKETSLKQQMFCSNVIRKGGVGYIGATDEAGYLNFLSIINEIFANGKEVGKAFKDAKNSSLLLNDPSSNNMGWSSLLGDPTLILNTTHSLPKYTVNMVSGGANSREYKVSIPAIKTIIPTAVKNQCATPSQVGTFYHPVIYIDTLNSNDYNEFIVTGSNRQFVVKIDKIAGFIPTSITFPNGTAKLLIENNGNIWAYLRIKYGEYLYGTANETSFSNFTYNFTLSK